MRDLVFVKFNSKLRNKKQNKDRDPIEKDVEDVQADNDNEFITGAVYVPSEHAEPGATTWSITWTRINITSTRKKEEASAS